MMKSILIITPYCNIAGGVETVTEALVQILKEEGHQVEKLTADNLIAENSIEKFLVKILGLPYLTSKAFRKMESSHFDHVICNGEYSWGIRHRSVFAYFHGSYMGLREYSSQLNWKNFIALSWRSFLQKRAAKNKKVVAVSEFLKNILNDQGIITDYIIANPVDVKKFFPENKIKAHNYVFIGRFDYFAKGFDILEKLVRRSLDISVYSLSESTETSLKLNPSPPSYDLNKIYNQYRILIFPSRFESFGMVPAEAMAAGLPVLMHPVGIGQKLKKDIPSYVIDNFLDENLLNKKIEEINNNYVYYSELSRKYAVENFSLEQFKRDWMRILNA